MRKAFTMIELIFIIVIIGILAAVAIPKLSSTRADAKGAMIASQLALCINDAGNEYMVNGSFSHLTQVDHATSSCNDARECFSFVEKDNNGTLVVDNLNVVTAQCIKAQDIASRNLLATTHNINF